MIDKSSELKDKRQKLIILVSKYCELQSHRMTRFGAITCARNKIGCRTAVQMIWAMGSWPSCLKCVVTRLGDHYLTKQTTLKNCTHF